MTPYSISMVFMISCINSDESIRPSANEIAISDLQEAMNVLNSPFETGTSTLIRYPMAMADMCNTTATSE